LKQSFSDTTKFGEHKNYLCEHCPNAPQLLGPYRRGISLLDVEV